MHLHFISSFAPTEVRTQSRGIKIMCRWVWDLDKVRECISISCVVSAPCEGMPAVRGWENWLQERNQKGSLQQGPGARSKRTASTCDGPLYRVDVGVLMGLSFSGSFSGSLTPHMTMMVSLSWSRMRCGAAGSECTGLTERRNYGKCPRLPIST